MAEIVPKFYSVFMGTTERSELDVVIEKDINIGIKTEHFSQTLINNRLDKLLR